MSNNLEYEYRQISCQRAVGGSNFASGVQDFNWSIGRPKSWIPARSYFRIEIELLGKHGADAPDLNDQVALADNVASALYNNVYARMGGRDVSSITNYVPQAHQVKTRLDKSGSWLDTIGKAAFGHEADFQTRVNNTVQVVPAQLDGALQTVLLGANDTQETYTIAISPLGVLTGVATMLWQNPAAGSEVAGDRALAVGDQLLVNGSLYTVKTAPAEIAGASCVVTPAPAVEILATHQAFKVIREKNSQGANKVYVNWTPPIGLFDRTEPLGSGDYRLQLNPSSYYKTAAVQMLQDNMTGGVGATFNFDLKVNDVQFFAALVTADIPISGVETMHLMEMQVQSKGLTSASGNNLLDFTVPPSTKAISIFVQSQDSGSNTLVPHTLFKTKNQSDEDMRSIQIQYANQNKPSTRHTSEYKVDSNFMQQRYLDTQMYSGRMWSEGGSEGFGDWIKRGPLYHWSWVRDQSDRSTHCQVNIQYGSIEANANLFIVAHYTNAIAVTTENGFITDVESLAT
jgi:hypothetical protein